MSSVLITGASKGIGRAVLTRPPGEAPAPVKP